MEFEKDLSVVEQLSTTRQLEELVTDAGLIDNPVVKAALAAAYDLVDQSYGQSPDEIESLTEQLKNADAAKAQLIGVREQMVSLGLSTEEVDKRIESERPELDDQQLSAIAYFAGRKIVSEEAVVTRLDETTVKDDSQERLSDKRQVIVGFQIDDSANPVLLVGRRKVKLSAVNDSQTDYSAERFAAVAVLSELLPGEEIPISELWGRIQTKVFGKDEISDIDRYPMVSVRRFIADLKFGNQNIFYHNEKRGLSSAYGVNPKINFEVIMDGSDKEIVDFAQALLEKRELATKPVDFDDPIISVPEVDIHPDTVIVQEAAVERQTLPEVIEIPDSLPNLLEFYSFLVKVQSTMPRVSSGIAIDEQSMLARLYEVAEETVDYIEQFTDKDVTTKSLNKEILDIVRTDVVEKFIAITEDDDMLNDLLDDNYQVILRNAYGEEVVPKVIEVIETILDMDDLEKNWLRQIILSDGQIKVTVDGGSFSKGYTVVGASVDHVDLSITKADKVSQQEDFVDDIIDAELEVIEEQDRDDTAPESLLNTEETKPPETDKSPERPKLSVNKLIRLTVGETILKIQEAGIAVDDRIGSKQAEAVFGIKIMQIVGAKETNLIQENATEKDLRFEDIATILIANSPNDAVKKIMSVPRLRKQLRKQLKRSISAL